MGNPIIEVPGVNPMDKPPQLTVKPNQRGQVPILRRIHCGHCRFVLAAEAGYPNSTAIEWYTRVNRDNEWHSWKHGKWWGNVAKCLVCGHEERLPMDKPLCLIEGGNDGD